MTHIAVPYFFARPEAAPPWPGVVVVLEGNGMSPWLGRICQRLAHEGFAALAPDLFFHFGGSDPDTSMAHMGELTPELVLPDLSAAVAELHSLGAAKVGMTGFCMGGRLTYLSATSEVDIACAAPFYGGGIAQVLGTPTCPLLAFFGGTDQWIPPADIEAVQRHHGEDVVVYPEAGHGFLRDGSEAYHEEASKDAWPRLLAFLHANLDG